MKSTILLTGANGFLGTQIALKIIEQSGHEIIALVRGKNKKDAVNRLCKAWWEFPEILKELNNRIQVVNGDITRNSLGMEENEYEKLFKKINHIIHTAADWKLTSSLEELEKVNVQGTQNMLKLARLAHEDHILSRFSYISTAYVAGGKKGTVSEDSLTDKYGFLSDYEKTKFESEVEVKKSGFNVSIFRPSMIVGDSSNGYIKTFNTVYVLLRLYLNGKLPLIPVSKSMKINLVPVDYVADSVVKLTFDKRAADKTFHLTAPKELLPTVKELIQFVRNWSRKNIHVKLNDPIYMPLNASILQKFYFWGSKIEDFVNIEKIVSKGHLFGKETSRLLETMDTLYPYFHEDRDYSRDNTDELLGPYPHKWQDLMPKILEFAVYYGFFHRSDRTVQEQTLFRLKSSSKPVTYFDVVNGEFRRRSSTDVYDDIIAATKSLKSLGVNKGDRIAIVGFNSTRYLTIDISVGLIGGVSVPLYYTSPLSEIREILKDSKANVIFAGTPALVKELKELELKIPVISFCQGEIDHPSHIISWNKFLKMGKNEKYVTYVPVNFKDVATIRYTSGTTGKPRGVVFNHGNLRWMAEFIASIPPWKDRINELSYLSFLPMNHVVEGIMGTYSPYYTPAPLKLYFLENFGDLREVLPKIRPKIFFSVPRLYEKVWCNVLESSVGRFYVNSSGILKKIIGKLLKRQILKKTGLDRCAQLIVGSAPISDDLLNSYHEMGIEVYNAYGLTEAPLITINRVGRNRIGTVGEPLPDTEICIDQDGEILVKGPQVTSGYFNKESDSLFKEGWLITGDFGYLTPEGSLVITGRKKEVIVNSYGKTISPLKIEGLLKNIPGIEEAMLIGDGKPYCSALLWVEETELDLNNVDNSIKRINEKLSRPEQVKAWVVLKNNLLIGRDLTANLKLKRSEIIKHYNNVIKFIYNSAPTPKSTSMLYYGRIEV